MKQFVRKYDKKITERMTATRSASDAVRPVFSPRAFAHRCQKYGSAYKEKQDRMDPAQWASIEFIRKMGRCSLLHPVPIEKRGGTQ